MINFIGTLKSVQLKSKVGDDERIIHNVQISLQISDGVESVQDLVESLKQLVRLDINNVQPTLAPTAPVQYKDGDSDSEDEE